MKSRAKWNNEIDLKFLVVGYNQCAFTQEGTRPDMLSEPLVSSVRKVNYSGFIGCTQRAFVRLKWLKDNAKIGRASCRERV